MARRVGVVGAGIGGLATALRLAHEGCEVEVFEKLAHPGGRNARLRVGQADFDAGPTLVMMLDPFRRVFEDVGERIEDHLDLRLLDPGYRAFFPDGSTIDATSNVARLTDAVRRLAGPADALRVPEFLGRTAALYRDAVPNFVERNYRSVLDLASPKAVGLVLKHGMTANLYRRVCSFFEDDRLRRLFSFQTLYLGMSPTDAPWVYAVLAFMEYGGGVWYPMGGVAGLTEALARLAEARGVRFHFETPVRAIGAGTIEACGRTHRFDAVVCNADLPYARRHLRQRPLRRSLRHSCSAIMLYADYRGSLDGLLHHNFVFGRDYLANLDWVFHGGPAVPDPAFYCCASSLTDPSRAAPGHHNLMLLIPCPNLDRPLSEDDCRALTDGALDRLETISAFRRGGIREQTALHPGDWRDRLNLDKGAAFGLAHDFFQSACFRPANADRDGVVYVGASTVPGNGLPMVLISAELATERVRRLIG
ncbi:MAG: phytoene desaturase family protein [Fimbriimonadaceae bacterium]